MRTLTSHGDGGTDDRGGTGRSERGRIGSGAGDAGDGGVTEINGLGAAARRGSMSAVFLESHDGEGTSSGVSAGEMSVAVGA